MIQLLSSVQISGETAKKYCSLSKKEKVEFLKKHCGVDTKTAEAFVEKPLVHMDGKACCGGHSHNDKPDTVQEKAGSVSAKRKNPAKDA